MSGSIVVSISQLTERHREAIRAAADAHGLTVQFFDREEDAARALPEAKILFAQSAEMARHAPNLKWQCTPSAGVDHFRAEGVFPSPETVLTNSSGAYGVTIAEHVIMVTLEIMRRQQEYTDIVARREWKRDLAVRSIRNCRALLLGTGDIGQETAVRLRAFGPALLTGFNRSGRNPGGLFDRIIRPEDLDGILPETDLVVLSLPGTEETHCILDMRRLAMLPDGAIIVNVGRGSAIEQTALERELQSGRLYAALDVFEQEPIPAEDTIWESPHLLITPHTAGNMTLPYTLDRIVDLFLEDLENYMQGRPLKRRVDLERGY